MPRPLISDPLAEASPPIVQVAGTPAAAAAAMPKAFPPQPSLMRLDCLEAHIRLMVQAQAQTQAQLQPLTMLLQGLGIRMQAIEPLLETQTQAQLQHIMVDRHRPYSGDGTGVDGAGAYQPCAQPMSAHM